jgi:hypothetical protein
MSLNHAQIGELVTRRDGDVLIVVSGSDPARAFRELSRGARFEEI